MMVLYRIFILVYGAAIRIAAMAGQSKAKAWVKGRQDWRTKLKIAIGSSHRWSWFHCASLGEFEQGRSLIEGLRKKRPDEKILLTFFSPSGYEIRKDYAGADHVCYLPLDTPNAATDFLSIVSPARAIFIKYEYWFHLLAGLERQATPCYLVSGIFRPGQWLFTFPGRLLLGKLKAFTHFYLQDEASARLLATNGFLNTTVAGDTRFDRVVEVAGQNLDAQTVEQWCKNRRVIIAGSTWPADEEALLSALKVLPESVRLMLVPHEISESHLKKIETLAQSICPDKRLEFMSRSKSDDLEGDILVIDRIGWLSRLYRLADVAYVGGGFGAGIHNTLEAAVYGVPVVFGPHYHKFREAHELISCGAGFSCSTKDSVTERIRFLLGNPEAAISAGKAAAHYVASKTGATNVILEAL